MSNELNQNAYSSLTVGDVYQKFSFSLKIIDGEKNFNNQITKPGLNRIGFELTGFYLNDRIKNVVVLGNREYTYLQQLNSLDRYERLKNIFALNPPLFLLTQSFKDTSFLTEINKELQIPILQSDLYSNDISTSIGAYISECLASYEMIHGVLIEVFGEGVLITGESGIGKSEIAMEMIKKNHMFVADDAVDIARIGARVLGKANAVAKNFIEVRGLGILNISKMFGIEKIKDSTFISVAINLVNIGNSHYSFERLGTDSQTKIFAGIKIPFYTLPISPGRKTSDLIESVVIDLKLKREGYNSANEFLTMRDSILKIPSKNDQKRTAEIKNLTNSKD